MWRRPKNVNYKERWLAAVQLLGDTGRLTDEEVRRISGEESLTQKAATAKVSHDTLSTLHRMASWDRAKLEVQRAQQGLPPLDDLAGMASWDQEKVLSARMRYETI